MKQFIILIVCLSIVSSSLVAQSKKAQRTVTVSTTLNYYPSVEPYAIFNFFETTDPALILNFLTPNSGTFVLEEGEALLIERNKTVQTPSQLFGLGMSVQIMEASRLFHEISLTKFNISKSSIQTIYTHVDSLDRNIRFLRGYDQRSSAFAFRYELGKYFGKRKSAKVRFGLSGSIEPSLYSYKRTPKVSSEFPLKANIFTIEVAAIPMISAKLNKKLTFDFKVIPNMLIADFGNFSEENPSFTLRQQKEAGQREYKSLDFNVAFSALIRYTIKEPEKKRRRRTTPNNE
jgi:hypothetical protein